MEGNESSLVRIKDLVSRPELNDARGMRVGPLQANGRAAVRLLDAPNEGTMLSLKPANYVEIAPDEDGQYSGGRRRQFAISGGCRPTRGPADLNVPEAPAHSLPPPAAASLDEEAEEEVIDQARYVETSALKALLSHDPALGGTPVKLVRARWLLENFQATVRVTGLVSKPELNGREGIVVGRQKERALVVLAGEKTSIALKPQNLIYAAAALLGDRQKLERESPEAFADEAMLERVLGEVATSYGEHFHSRSAEMTFPGLVSLSHCWLALVHPDPEARNLREKWLPPIEWYFSERVRRACEARGDRPGVAGMNERMVAMFKGASDAKLLELCDFAVFIDLTA